MYKYDIGDRIVYTAGHPRIFNTKYVGEEAIITAYEVDEDGENLYTLDMLGDVVRYKALEENIELVLPKTPDWRV